MFGKDNKVKRFISERGNQRIEIMDTKTKEIWQTLEATSPQKDMSNYKEIDNAIMSGIMQQLAL